MIDSIYEWVRDNGALIPAYIGFIPLSLMALNMGIRRLWRLRHRKWKKRWACGECNHVMAHSENINGPTSFVTSLIICCPECGFDKFERKSHRMIRGKWEVRD